MRIYLCQMNPTIGDLEGNSNKIVKGIEEAKRAGASVALFPELAITGYPPEDFLLLPHFIKAVSHQLECIAKETNGIVAIVGLPRKSVEEQGKPLHNSAAVLQNGRILGFQDKFLLPTYDVFSERRYFEPAAGGSKVWEIEGKRVVITICEDIWMHGGLIKGTHYRSDPIEEIKQLKPDIHLNISASPYNVAKVEERLAVCKKAAIALKCPLLLCNQAGANDSLIFDGHSVYVNGEGKLNAVAKGFEEDFLLVDLEAEEKELPFKINPIKDLYTALALGLKDYFHKSGFTSACLGLSGGIDSAVVACIAAEALGNKNILGVTMPSRYSSEHSVTDAESLSRNLGIEIWNIPIEKPFQSYLDILDPHFSGRPHDVTEENLQARIRGMIMMAISNKLGYVVLSTGNKSEMALGYATLYGDMCGGLGVINDVTKQQVYALAHWINRDREIIPWNTIHKPPSAELRPNQKDSDTLPDYEVLDTIVQAYVEDHLSPEEIAARFSYPIELVMDLVRRIHRNEYKRRQGPPGLRISPRSFSVGRRFPIVQNWI